MENRLTRSKSCLEQVLKDMLVEQESKNYLTAHKMKLEAQKLKEDIKKYEKKDFRSKHRKQYDEVVASQNQELKNWRSSWESQIQKYTEKAEELERQLQSKHEEEIKQIQRQFEAEFREYRESSAIIELKRKQSIFSKQTQYLEAHQAYTERLKIEKEQREAHEKLKNAKLQILLKKTKLRQQTEMDVLIQKKQTKLAEFAQTMQKQEKALIQKHKNWLRELSGEQEKQNLLRNGLIKNNSSMVALHKSMSPSSTYSRLKSPSKSAVRGNVFGESRLSTQCRSVLIKE